MGMSKDEKAVFAQFQAAIANLSNPKSNPGQTALTDSALAGYNWLQGGNYTQLPKGMFFNFEQPDQQLEQYKKLANVGQGGTFALANGGSDDPGRSAATAMQGQYLQDRFARDASQNYQNNVSTAGMNIQNALGQAAGAQAGVNSQVVNAYQNLLGSPALHHPSIWGSVLGALGSIGSAAIHTFGG